MTTKLDRWHWKTIGHPSYASSSFMHHQWIQIWVTVQKPSNWVKFDDFLPPVTLKFYEWPWKTIGHLFYTHSNFMHPFIAIGGFRFELQSGRAQIGLNLTIFLPPVTLKFYGWPWKTTGHLFYTHSSFMYHFIAIGRFRFDLQSGNSQIGSNLTIFWLPVTLKFYRWHWKTIGHLFYNNSSVMHSFIAIGRFRFELQSGNAQIG